MDRDDPQLVGPDGFWQAVQAPKLFLRAAFRTHSGNARVYWKRSDASDFSETKSVSFPIFPDGRYHTYVVDLSALPEYCGAITGLRLDPEPAGQPGDFARIKSISYKRT